MIRVAVIGSSHVAALKLGWDSISADWPEVAFTFFAAPGRHARAHKLRGMVYGLHDVEPEAASPIFGHDGGPTIDLGEMDYVIRSGQRSGLVMFADLLRSHAIGPGPANGRPFRLSRPALTAICHSIAKERLPDGPWLDWEGTRLVLCPAPIPDENLPTDTTPRLDDWRALAAQPEEFHHIRQLYAGIYEEALASAGVGLLGQPEESLAESGLTRLAYSSGAHLMFRDEDERDVLHMNADYGALQLGQFLTRIGAQHASDSARKKAG